jgi:hypothetical protein
VLLILVLLLPLQIANLGVKKKGIVPGSRQEGYFTKVATALLSKVEGLLCGDSCVEQGQLWEALSHTKHFRAALLAVDTTDGAAISADVTPLVGALSRVQSLADKFPAQRKYTRLFTQLLSLLADRATGRTIDGLIFLLGSHDIRVTSYQVKLARTHSGNVWPKTSPRRLPVITPVKFH